MDFGWLQCVNEGSWTITNEPSGGDVDNRGGYTYMRVGGIWETSVPSSQFFLWTQNCS